MTTQPTNSIHNPCPYGNDDCPKCTTNSIDSELAEILEEWLNGAQATSSMGVTIDDIRSEDDRDREYIEALNQALQAIKSLYRKEVEEAIGEDEPVEPIRPSVDTEGNVVNSIRKAGRNQLRAKLRAKLLPPTKGGNDE